MKKVLFNLILLFFLYHHVSYGQQVITQDLVVQGSECIGLDCPNNVVPNFMTILMRENNLRIRFEDTSSSASFPANDWELTANDSSNGGLNHFSITDATANRAIFKMEAGARANSIYIDDSGRIGYGTNSPLVGMHQVNGNTPTLRLDQDGSESWAPHIWDIAGNEANFFIRDVSNGSLLPFRIKPGAPTNTLYLNASGNVAIGGTNDSHKLYVNGDAAVSGDVFVLSDKRIKKDIKDLNNGIEKIMQLKPKVYQYDRQKYTSLNLPEQGQIGLIAQEVEAVLPDVITQNHSTINQAGKSFTLKGVNYTKLVPVLIQAVKEQQVELEAKDKQLLQLQSEVELLKKQFAIIQNSIQSNTSIKKPKAGSKALVNQDDPNAKVIQKGKKKTAIVQLKNGRDEQ